MSRKSEKDVGTFSTKQKKTEDEKVVEKRKMGTRKNTKKTEILGRQNKESSYGRLLR